tara:strand:+ start:1142 stop:1336 length:195 start_codon:yes stop_codon:yes gene_type:complete
VIAKKILNIITVSLLATLLFSLGALLHSINELEKIEEEIKSLQVQKSNSIEAKLDRMIERMEKE